MNRIFGFAPSPGKPLTYGFSGFVRLYFRNFFNVVKLNLLFVLFSLPVFTAGASLCALNTVCAKIIDDEPISYFYEFKKSFRQNFKAGTLAWAACLPLLLLAGLALNFYYSMRGSSPMFTAALLFTCFLSYFIVMTFMIVYTTIPRYGFQVGEHLKNGAILVALCVKRCLLTFFIVLVFSFLLFIALPFSVPLVVLFYFSTCCMVSSYILTPDLRKHLEKPAENAC